MSKAASSNPEPRAITKQFALLPKILNGGIAGVIAVTCVFPMDLVKTRLQNQQIGPDGEKMYKNILDCFRKTYRAEGYFGMYRGSGVNILLVTPEKAIKLASNDYFRHKFTRKNGDLPLTSQMLAGGLAGACQIIVTTPMELLKIQMQDAGRIAAHAKLAGKTVERISGTKLVLQLLKEKGLFGFYRGIGATAWRDVGFSLIYFPMFAALNEMGPQRKDGSGEAVAWVSLLSGLFSGAVCAILVTPFDVVKTRLQTMKKAEGEKEFKGIIDCFVKTFKYEGVTALFKGGICRMMVLAPVFGIAQMVYFIGIGESIVGFFK